MAAELGDRVRLGAVVERIAVDGARGSRSSWPAGRRSAPRRWCAPSRPGRCAGCELSGLSDARLASLRAQRHALAAKVVVAYADSFWQRSEQNGLAETEWLFGSTWPQRAGVLSLLVPPERLSAFLAAPPPARRRGEFWTAWWRYTARGPASRWRCWSVPGGWTRSRSVTSRAGLRATWAASGRCTVRHEPPFYVAGSDHWVAGYMEGAVRTGRAAARAALGTASAMALGD